MIRQPDRVAVYCHGEMVIARRSLVSGEYFCTRCGTWLRVVW